MNALSSLAGARRAIVDIGSNSIRLVVFGGAPRAPVSLYNEKIMAGLGKGVVETGRLDPAAADYALKGLARFAAVLSLLPNTPVRVVATAAVREAADGAEFLDKVRALGLPAEVLDGDGEALGAGYGVISACPDADGIVADMGGGSLELARVSGGAVHERISLPLGAMRVAQVRAGGTGKLRKTVRAMLKPLGWIGGASNLPLYCVGGSWRTLARVHMAEHGWQLPVLGNYAFPAGNMRSLKARVRALGPGRLAGVPGVKAARIPQLDDATALLAALVAVIGSPTVVISAAGLREGLLYGELDEATRAQDPLIAGVMHAVGVPLDQPDEAATLVAWSDPLFAGEPAGDRRLRHAAYLLAGTGWASNPDFRVVAGEDLALHGNWAAVDGAGRAQMAAALHIGLGGSAASLPPLLSRLADPAAIARAATWGHALRFGQRLSGNNASALPAVPLRREEETLVLTVPKRLAELADPAAERRLGRVAAALGLTPVIAVGS